MKPFAKYVFRQSETARTRYILQEHFGEKINGFPAVYAKGKNAGLEYIGFRATVIHKMGGRHFSHTFELSNSRTFTGVNFTELDPCKTFGDSKSIGRNDCILIEFSKDYETLTMLFFKDLANVAETVFEKWLNGDIPETVESDCLQIAGKRKTASQNG